MAEIRIKLEGQLLMVQNQEIIASGNVNYDTCAFTFDGAWEGFVRTAVFYQKKTEVHYAILGGDNICTIPSAAMAGEGNMYIGVFGISGPKVLTSTVERVYIRQGAISGDTVSAEPADDIFLAIIAQYRQISERMQGYDLKMEEFIGILNALNAYDVSDVMGRLTAAEQKLAGMRNVIDEAVGERISAVSGGLRFAQDGNGEWGYIVPGSTDVIPFSAQGYVNPGWDGELENTIWTQVPSGTYSNFVKAICKNGYPIAITADGTVVYSTDGESWEKSKPEYRDCKFTDIDWDGERYLITGSYVTAESNTVGLLLTTEDFKQYSKIDIHNGKDTDTAYDAGYYAVYPANGKYIVVAVRKGENNEESLCAYICDFANEGIVVRTPVVTFGITRVYNAKVEKNSIGMLVHTYYRSGSSTPNDYEGIFKLSHKGIFTTIFWESASNDCSHINVFSCKDALYYFSDHASDKYEICKVLESNEKIAISTGKNFAFVGGVYFNTSEAFINAHGMLIVKRGENIAEKTVDDLIEISPETSMSCITKAFGRIYIFGNQGMILKPA